MVLNNIGYILSNVNMIQMDSAWYMVKAKFNAQ